ncbi:MAG: hypothetical protein ABIA75_10465 [Candidatus Neomarinimicrobiota bacterium]
MPVTTSFNKDQGFIYHLLTGDITQKEIITAFDNSQTYPDLAADTHVIWEFQNVRLPKLSETISHVKAIANYVKNSQSLKRTGFKVALVADNDLVFGMSRMYQSVATFLPVQFMVFRKYEAAENWVQGQDQE